MSDYDHDQDPYNYDDDEQFYEDTVYNEEWGGPVLVDTSVA
jgi:hypothetical protein